MADGIINVYKEKGYTSHDVVAKMRGILKQKKIGHTGTLDPQAEGVLPVCLGTGTKLCSMLTDKIKTYQAVMILGVETDTQDMTGQILNEFPVTVTQKQVQEAVESFLGGYQQIPPMYSAIKVGGKKLYELARAGKEIERQPRPVEIIEISVDSINLPKVTMTVTCSKGTYIRTLCYDIGKKLGCGGCMDSLIRTRVSDFTIEDSLTLGQIESLQKEGSLAGRIIPVDEMFSNYLSVVMKEPFDRLVHNGNSFFKEQAEGEYPEDGGLLRVYDSQNVFIGIYQLDEKANMLKTYKLFLGGR